MKYRHIQFDLRLPQPELSSLPAALRRWLPSRGSVVFTLIAISALLWAQQAGAIPLAAPSAASTGTIAYQGRLADASGQPLTQTVNMIFRLYGTASGGSALWEEQWTGANSVQVSDGLFNVMLGSLTPIPASVIAANSSLFLGITAGTDSEMAPRVQLGSVPFAAQALTVPDGSITKAKLAADVSLVPPDDSVTTAKIADGAVTPDKSSGFVTTSIGGNLLVQHVRRHLVAGTSTRITFPKPYSSVPTVVAVPDSLGGQWINVDSVNTTGFSVTIPNTGGNVAINWIAIGTVD